MRIRLMCRGVRYGNEDGTLVGEYGLDDCTQSNPYDGVFVDSKSAKSWKRLRGKRRSFANQCWK